MAKSGRNYLPLPIDSTKGYPQTFSWPFEGQTYYFRLYVNISSHLLEQVLPNQMLPSQSAFLVVQVEQDTTTGNRETIFLRKVVPNLEYEAAAIALTFSSLDIARTHLNGQGDFGSKVIGGMAKRWE
jgi:hypothetical protein